jgi:hypothetical protein
LVASDGQYNAVSCHTLRAAMLLAHSSSRAWAVTPLGMTGCVGGSFSGMVNTPPLRAREMAGS